MDSLAPHGRAIWRKNIDFCDCLLYVAIKHTSCLLESREESECEDYIRTE